jgi:hypothetical protein
MTVDHRGPTLRFSHHIKGQGSTLIGWLLLGGVFLHLRAGPDLLAGDKHGGELQLDALHRVAPQGLRGRVQEPNVQEVRLTPSFRSPYF